MSKLDRWWTLIKSYITSINQRRWLWGLGLFVVSLTATLTYFFAQKPIGVSLAPENQVLSAQTQRELTKEKPDELKSVGVLLLGYGGAGHQGGFLTDVIQLVHIDFERNKVAFISIPRDLWAQLPNGQQAKINTAFSLGDSSDPIITGGEKAKEMTSIVTGLPVDYFIAIDFVGLQRLVGEELGGLTVNVPETLEDPWYPIKGEELNPCGMTPEEVASVTAQYSGFELEKQFECRYEHLYYPAGITHMEGGDVLKYVRSRHGSSAGDFSRSMRQHAVLEAFREKLISLDALANAPEIFGQVNRQVSTDLDLEVIEYLLPAINLAQDFEIKKIIISTENVLTSSKSNSGAFILIPRSGQNNWNSIHTYIQGELDQ